MVFKISFRNITFIMVQIVPDY
ncbi:Hypothetical protein EIN_451240, partial [Entamoeba invadens IP1]